MPFASINPNNPKPICEILKIGDFEKLTFFELAILLHPHENQSKVLGYQGWDEILMIILVSSQKSPTPNISAASVCDNYSNLTH